jgi:hypothetical protein
MLARLDAQPHLQPKPVEIDGVHQIAGVNTFPRVIVVAVRVPIGGVGIQRELARMGVEVQHDLVVVRDRPVRSVGLVVIVRISEAVEKRRHGNFLGRVVIFVGVVLRFVSIAHLETHLESAHVRAGIVAPVHRRRSLEVELRGVFA